MKGSLDLGFVALTDAATLVVARERGLFADEGLDVTLHREVSWATIRDKVTAELYQGAHMLAPMMIATNLGVGSEPASLMTPVSLNANGAALGVSAQLFEEMGQDDPKALAHVVARRLGRGAPAITFAVVFPYSMHNYMLRFWLASAGIDPDRDIRIVTAAPTSIADRLTSGEIDGFCVGAPWGAACEAGSGARIVLEADEFWPGGPDKVLGLSGRWVEREPSQALALTRAVLRAGQWADQPENRTELAQMLAHDDYLGVSPDLIAVRLPKIRFSRHAASFPWRSQAAWIVSQMLRWGQVDQMTDTTSAVACYRPDLFRAAAAGLGFPTPTADSKTEGGHDVDWALPGSPGPISMVRDTLLDRAPFNPDSLRDYAAAFPLTRFRA